MGASPIGMYPNGMPHGHHHHPGMPFPGQSPNAAMASAANGYKHPNLPMPSPSGNSMMCSPAGPGPQSPYAVPPGSNGGQMQVPSPSRAGNLMTPKTPSAANQTNQKRQPSPNINVPPVTLPSPSGQQIISSPAARTPGGHLIQPTPEQQIHMKNMSLHAAAMQQHAYAMRGHPGGHYAAAAAAAANPYASMMMANSYHHLYAAQAAGLASPYAMQMNPSDPRYQHWLMLQRTNQLNMQRWMMQHQAQLRQQAAAQQAAAAQQQAAAATLPNNGVSPRVSLPSSLKNAVQVPQASPSVSQNGNVNNNKTPTPQNCNSNSRIPTPSSNIIKNEFNNNPSSNSVLSHGPSSVPLPGNISNPGSVQNNNNNNQSHLIDINVKQESISSE